MCIHAAMACNGVAECPDGSDERRAACKGVGLKSPPCLTIGGQDPLRPCIFPFVYRGEWIGDSEYTEAARAELATEGAEYWLRNVSL